MIWDEEQSLFHLYGHCARFLICEIYSFSENACFGSFLNHIERGCFWSFPVTYCLKSWVKGSRFFGKITYQDRSKTFLARAGVKTCTWNMATQKEAERRTDLEHWFFYLFIHNTILCQHFIGREQTLHWRQNNGKTSAIHTADSALHSASVLIKSFVLIYYQSLWNITKKRMEKKIDPRSLEAKIHTKPPSWLHKKW